MYTIKFYWNNYDPDFTSVITDSECVQKWFINIAWEEKKLN